MCSYDVPYTGFADDAGAGHSRQDTDRNFCELVRNDYLLDAEEKFANETLTPRYALEAKMIDTWAAALTGLDGKAAPQKGRALSLDFHGAYGLGTGARHYVNPQTNYISCPNGTNSSPLLGRDHVDWMATQCTAKPDLTAEPTLDFGGFIGRYNTPMRDTGWACPAGFPTDAYTQIHGATGVDDEMWFCSKPHTAGTMQPYLYGGAYSRGGVNGKASWVNPATGTAGCPNGFVSSKVQGKTLGDGKVIDHPVVVCWRKGEAFEG